jgi:hypothetical protein
MMFRPARHFKLTANAELRCFVRRKWLVVATLLMALFIAPRSAKAWDWWDWAQEFSGPGPFDNRGGNLMFDLCPQAAQTYDEKGITPQYRVEKASDGKEINRPITEPFLRDIDVRPSVKQDGVTPLTGVPICYFADFRFFKNRPGDNFGVDDVDLGVYEFGVSARLHHAISLGFGFGRMQISTPTKTSWHTVLTGPRLVIKPLLIYGSPEFWRQGKTRRTLQAFLGTVKYYVKEDMVIGHLTAADFGVTEGPNKDFDVVGDRQWSTGFVFDLTEPAVLGIRWLAQKTRGNATTAP